MRAAFRARLPRLVQDGQLIGPSDQFNGGRRGFRQSHISDESVAAAVHRLDEPSRFGSITQQSTKVFDVGLDGLLGDYPVRPDRFEELLFGYQCVSAFGNVAEKVELPPLSAEAVRSSRL